jgi:hypothetical protein
MFNDAGYAIHATRHRSAGPHLKAREMIVDVDYPTRGTYQCPPFETHRCAMLLRVRWFGFTISESALENILRRHAKHDLTDRLVVQYAPLALLRDRVDVAQTAFERIFLEHRHRAAIVKQRIDDLP